MRGNVFYSKPVCTPAAVVSWVSLPAAVRLPSLDSWVDLPRSGRPWKTASFLCMTNANTGRKFPPLTNLDSNLDGNLAEFGLQAPFWWCAGWVTPGWGGGMVRPYTNVKYLDGYPCKPCGRGGRVHYPLRGYSYVVPTKHGTPLIRRVGSRRLSWVRDPDGNFLPLHLRYFGGDVWYWAFTAGRKHYQHARVAAWALGLDTSWIGLSDAEWATTVVLHHDADVRDDLGVPV